MAGMKALHSAKIWIWDRFYMEARPVKLLYNSQGSS